MDTNFLKMLNDLDLIILIDDLRKHPEDKRHLDKALLELQSRRHKEGGNDATKTT